MGVPPSALAICTVARTVPSGLPLAETVCSSGLRQSPTRSARFSTPPAHLL